MTTEARMRLIRGHLEAVSRGRSPGAEQIGVWLRELEGIPDEDLDPCIRDARTYHAEACDRGRRWGRLTPDDVLGIWRSKNISNAKHTGADQAPENPDCPIRCEGGMVLLVGSDGYDFVTRCSCPSGDWWAARSSRWRATTEAGEFLENPAFKLARPVDCQTSAKGAPNPMPESHAKWLRDRAKHTGMTQAMEEYRAHMAKQNRGTGVQSPTE